MQTGRSLSLVIPCRDMATHLEVLLDSVLSSGLVEDLAKIEIVDDGSVHREPIQLVAQEFAKKLARLGTPPEFELHELPLNLGRFQARLHGAERVSTDSILFLDCRVKTDAEFVRGLRKYRQKEPAIVGAIHIDESQSVFNLYWKRTHEVLFAASIPKPGEGHYINFQNFHKHVVGTGILLLPRNEFIQVCKDLGSEKIESDDTALLERYVQIRPLFRTAEIGLIWEPRQSLREFLTHLFIHRGITFAEFHILEGSSRFAKIFYLGFCGLIAIVVALILHPVAGLWIIGCILLMVLASTGIFAKNLAEALKMAPLHALVIGTYGFGILLGVLRLWARRLKAQIN